MQYYCISKQAMHKTDRHRYIRETLVNAEVRSQNELVSLLNAAGFGVTQASVSRDLEELHVIKANGRYVLPVRQNGRDPLTINRLLPSGDNLIVARCRSGLASAVAVRIDEARIEEIAGTIAGDDTIFIAVEDTKAQHVVIRKLWELFNTVEPGE